MPGSRHVSNSDAVSEVVGQILIFGILSTVLILALLGFNVAKEGANERVVEVRADAVAQQVASVVVEASLVAERMPADSLEITSRLSLPGSFDLDGYQIDLDEDQVVVRVRGITVTAALFSAGAPAGLVVCDVSTALSGGEVDVVVTTSTPPASICPNHGGAARAVYIEAA